MCLLTAGCQPLKTTLHALHQCEFYIVIFDFTRGHASSFDWSTFVEWWVWLPYSWGTAHTCRFNPTLGQWQGICPFHTLFELHWILLQLVSKDQWLTSGALISVFFNISVWTWNSLPNCEAHVIKEPKPCLCFHVCNRLCEARWEHSISYVLESKLIQADVCLTVPQIHVKKLLQHVQRESWGWLQAMGTKKAFRHYVYRLWVFTNWLLITSETHDTSIVGLIILYGWCFMAHSSLFHFYK